MGPETGATAVDRNIVLDEPSEVSSWPFEAVHAAIDRGTLADWRRLAAEVRRSPWGHVARAVVTVTGWGEHPGIDQALAAAVERAREDVVTRGMRRWADHIRALREATGLSMRQFAALAGTSASRLSDYENARVAPTTDALARLEHAGEVGRR